MSYKINSKKCLGIAFKILGINIYQMQSVNNRILIEIPITTYKISKLKTSKTLIISICHALVIDLGRKGIKFSTSIDTW